jgi:hypothetical protein
VNDPIGFWGAAFLIFLAGLFVEDAVSDIIKTAKKISNEWLVALREHDELIRKGGE